MLDKLTYKSEDREKKNFYASDFYKPLLDLYFGFKGTAPSNPPSWYDTLKWGAGKGVEMAMLDILKMNGIVDESYNQEENGRISIEREGVTINGYIDAIMKDGSPIEIKSINNANKFDIKKYEDGAPRDNYVGQLAVYMDALGVDTGYLFVSSIDGLHRFWFKARREGDRVICGRTIVELDKEYKRWSKLYTEHIVTDTPPDLFEYTYKIPVDQIDWKDVSKSAIGKARNNQAVIGDYQISYSKYKDIIIGLQGETLGYTPDEVEYIKNATKGFTTWGKG